MRHLILPLVAALTLTACQDEPTAGMKTSAQGHVFAFMPMPDAAQVSVEVSWPMPWPLQTGRNPAVPYIGADLLLGGGAGAMSPSEVQETFADLTAQGYLYVAGTTLRGGVIAPPDRLDAAIGIANLVLQKPSFSQEWLIRIRDTFAASQIETQKLAANQGWQAVRNVVLGDQPLNAYLSIGDIAAIRATTQTEVQQWHAETVVSKGALIAVAGPLTEAEAGVAVDALFDGLPSGPAPKASIMPLDYTAHTILLHVPTAQKTTLGLIARVPPTGDDGEVDDLMASLILGGDDQSLLFSAIRTDLRASYGFAASLDAYTRDDRILVLSGEVDTAQTAAVRDLVVKTYASLFVTPVPPGTMARWKTGIGAQLQQAETDPASRSTAMIEAMHDKVDPLRVLQLQDMLAKSTPESVQARVKARYTPADALLIIAVSPDANALPGACVITDPAEAVNCP